MSAVVPESFHAASIPAGKGAAPARAKDVTSAIERLALSRELLRTAMLPVERKLSGHGLASGVGAMASSLADRLKSLPGAAVFVEVVTDWWAHHPLRTAGHVAVNASRKLAAPVAERNPIGLLLCAVVAGALLAVSRPWRWLLRPALFAGLLPALALTAVRKLPLNAWLNVLGSFATPSRRAPVSPRKPVPELEESPLP